MTNCWRTLRHDRSSDCEVLRSKAQLIWDLFARLNIFASRRSPAPRKDMHLRVILLLTSCLANTKAAWPIGPRAATNLIWYQDFSSTKRQFGVQCIEINPTNLKWRTSVARCVFMDRFE